MSFFHQYLNQLKKCPYFGTKIQKLQDNSQYEGFYIKGNQIVKTLDRYFNKGVGNRITRLLFDTALLLYVDRFCPATYPTKIDVGLFERFVTYAFVWAYSLRAQYTNLGWQSAQNYVLEKSRIINSLNIYKLIADSDTPVSLLSMLADMLSPLSKKIFLTGCIRKWKKLMKLRMESLDTIFISLGNNIAVGISPKEW